MNSVCACVRVFVSARQPLVNVVVVAADSIVSSHRFAYFISSRSTSKIVEAAQMVIASSKDKSGADKLRREMIPRGSDGTSPRIISFRNGEAEGMCIHSGFVLLEVCSYRIV